MEITATIVSTWAELVKSVKTEFASIAFPEEPGTINIEAEYGNSEPPMLSIARGVTIDGKGWNIHGLWAKTHSMISINPPWDNSNAVTIKNLDLSSFHCQSDCFLTRSGYNISINLNGCRFSGICEGDFIRTVSPNASSCTMDIKFTSVDNPCFYRGTDNYAEKPRFSDCVIKTRGAGRLTIFNRQSSKNVTVQSCRLDLSAGDIQLFSETANTTLTGCILTGGSQSAIEIGNTSGAVNVFDRDAFPNAVESPNFIGARETDIKDPAYLSELGFSIGV